MKETYKLPVMCLVTTLRIVLPSVYVGNFDKQIQLLNFVYIFSSQQYILVICWRLENWIGALKTEFGDKTVHGPLKNGTKYRWNSYDKALYF